VKHVKLILIILVFHSMPPMILRGEINVFYTINTETDPESISPYIYGANSWDIDRGENFTARRIGGNRLTGYNWENNYSNAGKDWYHHSDLYLARNLPQNEKLIPGKVLTSFHDDCLSANQLSVITLQMAGYVAADGAGEVVETETAPSPRWKEVVFAKPDPFCNPPGSPNLTDDFVYMDECVNFLVSSYGNAATPTGVKCYSLDNEPALWDSTHPRIHPNDITCVEMIDRTVALSAAVKNVDPDALVFGPVFYGFQAFRVLQDAPDWDGLKDGYFWFLDYYLDELEAASASAGKRLVDVLDLHWYPEAKGDGIRITLSADTYSRANAEARMQAPRSLWDPDYVEDSWIGQWFSQYLPLLPNVQNTIDTYYPGTKLAITEYSYGAPNHISGGIAMADVLGLFGKYGLYLSTYWHLGGDRDYISAAFKIYRNYDGADSTFGDTKVHASMSDKVNSSVYASTFAADDSELHIIVMNKNFDDSINGVFTITHPRVFTTGRVWAFDADSSAIGEISSISAITGNSFSYSIPPLTVCHIALESDCPLGDLTGDCRVDATDLKIFCDQWLVSESCEGFDCADLNRDTKINLTDFYLLAKNWNNE
jgi:glycosyl hydrolase family 44/dockerin type I repeat protein